MGSVTALPGSMLMGQDFSRFMEESEAHAKVLPPSAFQGQFEAYRRDGGQSDSPCLPWSKTHENFQMRPGEVTLWAGTNGSGKSMVTSHVALSLMQQGHKVVTQSFEMKPIRQLERFIRQSAACKNFSDQAALRFFDWAEGRLWFYDQQGTVKPKMVMAVCRYAAQELGATNVVIDSLMKAVKGEDDYNGQKDFVDMLTSVARDYGIHIHLVHHTKKMEDETKIPSKTDAKGSGAIADLVDNVMMVWRNKPKEAIADAYNRGATIGQKEMEKLDAPDVILVCDKQRNHDWEGRIALWFDRGSWQYLGGPKHAAIPIGA